MTSNASALSAPLLGIQREEITCPLCLSVFTDPKALSCLHSFCTSCIVDHIGNTSRHGKIDCPICKKETIIPPAIMELKLPALYALKDERISVGNKELKASVDITNQVAGRKDKKELKYKYMEESRSPVDHENKKSYDREFLLSLQFVVKSLKKSDGLPELPEIILDQPITARNEADTGAMPKGSAVDFRPGYVRSLQGRLVGGGSGRRSGQRDRDPKHDKVPIDEKEDPQLHHVESDWKPERLRKTVDNLENHKTESVKSMMEAEFSSNSDVCMEDVIQQLHVLIVRDNLKNTDIFDWIKANLSLSRAGDPQFIRALMTSICSSAIVVEGTRRKADPKVISNRSILLQYFLGHNAKLELQALYGLQALVHKLQHPPGLLRVLFESLYDEDIISENAFKQWEYSKDPDEQEGKGTACRSVEQFFAWLNEADPEPDGGGAATS